jgi:hypothetical protein
MLSMATLKAMKLRNNLSSGKYSTIKECGLKAGYSPTVCEGVIYNIIRNPYFRDAITKSGMDNYFMFAADKALKDNDNTNLLRAGEDICKLNGLLKDNDTTVNIVSITDVYSDKNKIVSSDSVIDSSIQLTPTPPVVDGK